MRRADGTLTWKTLLDQMKTVSESLPRFPFSKGADVHPNTYQQLLNYFSLSRDPRQPPPTPDMFARLKFSGIEIHQRTDIPEGEVRECTCSKLQKLEVD